MAPNFQRTKYSVQFFYELKLPAQPLRPGATQELYQLKRQAADKDPVQYNTIHHDVKHFFVDEVLEPLKQLNLEPIFFVHFGSLDNTVCKTILHSDIVKHNNQWVPDCAAINWDLAPGQTDFVWYDTGSLEKIYPPNISNYNPLFEIHNGIHYGAKWSRDTSNCVELQRLSMARNTAYLVRTDVAHQISYSSQMPIRLAVSLRFHVQHTQSWDHVVESLKPLLDK